MAAYIRVCFFNSTGDEIKDTRKHYEVERLGWAQEYAENGLEEYSDAARASISLRVSCEL